MRPEEATSSILSEVWSQVRPQIQKSRFLEEAAQALATSLHTQFDESVVIARIFVTVPFNSLPRANKEFVRNLVEAAEAASDLKPGTPVLSLIGTHGQEEDWNDRRKSKGHVGIPLISSAFVDTIPMISRLLKELGVPLEWLDSHDAQIIVQSSGGTEALFFVDDALQAADEEGRKIISAQDFVSSYQVKSVFGTGGVYASGQIFVVVVFCRDSFARADAESFLALTQSFKNETASFSSSGSIFSVVGQTLSHYRILEKIGEGGMGEVYRAEDTSLKREVAIKVLPDRFTEDPERLARFEREAKLVASLNHPNLAAIYESEEADGKRFLVLELVKGETLAERLTKGPLPVEEALKVCLQVAKGIEAAHEEGVIHRDLKPANVQITPEGKVKILDFGLAKAFEGETSAAFSQAPTRAGETTKTGVIVGTTAYMSLEQARGEPVDERTDIWNFGCVLFECLTGKRAFEGETITETIAAVLTDNPQWDALPENTPWSIRTLLLRCLEKEANRRLRGMSDAKIEIEKALAEPTRVSGIEVTSAAQPARWRQVITLSITAVLASFVTGIAIWMFMPSSPPSPQLSKKLVITSLLNTTLFNNPGRNLAISPDGRRIAYQILSNGRAQLYLRSLDEFTTTLIPGTETMTGSAPIFSPDGESVLFVADSKLRKVSLPRGTPVTLSEMTRHRGGSWGPGDVIFLASDDDLYRVSAAGGEPEMLATVDREKGEVEYRQPEILPDGKALLFTIGRQNSSQIAILSLETGEKKIVVEGGREAHYAPTGHLVYEAAQKWEP